MLESIKIPAILKVYVSSHCTFCPEMVIQCLALAKGNPFIRVTVIDGTLFPDQAGVNMVRSVPTVILDDTFRWTGSVEPREMIEMISKRDPLLPGPESLKQIIHDGREEEVADMMAERGEVFPAFLEMLIHKNWTVRLETMVAFEYLLEKHAELCSKILEALWNMFPNTDDRVKGDIICLMGESGVQSVMAYLEEVIEGAYSQDVKEAAKDELENFEL